jgi:hypothetical protein
MKTVIISLLLLTSLASALPNDLTGTVVKVDDENSLWINITEPNAYNLMGVVQVLLATPEKGLQNFLGDELQFDVQGRDLLGRPVVEAYYNGAPLRYVVTPMPAIYREYWGGSPPVWYEVPYYSAYQYRHYVVETPWLYYGAYTST